MRSGWPTSHPFAASKLCDHQRWLMKTTVCRFGSTGMSHPLAFASSLRGKWSTVLSIDHGMIIIGAWHSKSGRLRLWASL